ncbi:ABC transporter permease [Paenibacillus soyae]|uniref:ABC transporter permease n=1 Tax=Paenibacillus soyae TaxID=2969249 RepID=A0A9X2SDL8_9BACL|nr:ABC transporter permease [Paenibacillus soyae]MCR2808028.1 ABC transporter permease [Paenibacillus soyae]
MNVWRIAIKELKWFRDPKMLVFLLATPILLMLILGTALSGAFQGSAAVGDIRVLYGASDGAAGARFEQWLGESSSVEGIVFEKSEKEEDAAVQDVKNGLYTGYVALESGGVTYYGSSRSVMENGIVQGMLTSFAERFKLETAIPDAAQAEGSAAGAGIVKETSLQGPKRPGAMDYFAIAVTTMCIMYGAASAGQLIDMERIRNTASRLLASPVTKAEIFAGKIIGTLLLNAITIAIVVLISRYMYGANWGSNWGAVAIVLMSQITFALSLGLGISYLVKGKAAGIIIMTIIQLAALFGGSYWQIEDNGDFVSKLSGYSPITWTNEALLGVIYGGGEGLMPASVAVLLNMGLSVVMLAAAAWIMRRRVGL